MRQKYKDTNDLSHLIFVTSRDHLDPNITACAEQSAKKGALFQYFSDMPNWPTGALDPNYANSKLMLTYAAEQYGEQVWNRDEILSYANTHIQEITHV
jgi:hypothetical protein